MQNDRRNMICVQVFIVSGKGNKQHFRDEIIEETPALTSFKPLPVFFLAVSFSFSSFSLSLSLLSLVLVLFVYFLKINKPIIAKTTEVECENSYSDQVGDSRFSFDFHQLPVCVLVLCVSLSTF